MTAAADSTSTTEEAQTIGRTPPRLSFLDGQVSFWRPGAEDWTQAQINTALAPGDQLYIQGSGNLELQVGARAYVRGGKDAQIGLVTQEPDFLRFKVTAGRVAFDLRTLAPGRTVEVDTPHGAVNIDHQGYYRLEVGDARTVFTTRRTGRASVAVGDGDAVPMEPEESVVIEGSPQKALAFQTAPEMDAWDTWNYDRTDALLEARSAGYVAPDTYGTADLDRYGSWRVLPTYGTVWVPAGVGPGWAPYSTGSWMHDPHYGWTWVDTAPWGWAPYHYGRWIYVNSYWCWAPGPRVRRAVYAPALVAFFGGPGVSVGISVGNPGVGWVALGWGEPLIPWWGRAGFIHRPWWGGWGGPRCINGRVIRHRTAVTVHDIHHYHNRRVGSALIVVDKHRFGRGHIHHRRFHNTVARDWRPLHRAPDVRPGAASFAPSARHGRRPPDKILKRRTDTFGSRHVRRPVAERRSRDGRRWSTRDDRLHPPRRDQAGSRSGSRTKTFRPGDARQTRTKIERQPATGRSHVVRRRSDRTDQRQQPHRDPMRTRSEKRTRSLRPSTPGHGRTQFKEPSADMKSGKVRRDTIARPHRTPAIHPKATRRANPRTARPAPSIKHQRRFSGASGTGRPTTVKEHRSRSIEKPTRIRRQAQQDAHRNAAPAHRPEVNRSRADNRGRITNRSVDRQPEVRRTQPRPERQERLRRTPDNTRRSTGKSFRSSPRAAEPRQSRFNNGRENSRGRTDGRWQFQSERGANSGSGHRFQRRFRD
jgi:hypothetical protein